MPDDRPVTVEFTLTQSEFARVARSRYLRSKDFKQSVALIAAMFIVAGLLLTRRSGVVASGAGLALTVGSVMLAGMLASMIWRPRQAWRKSAVLRGPHTLWIGSDHLEVADIGGRHEHAWAAVKSAQETKDSYAILFAGAFYCIPKRAFSSRQDEMRARELWRRRLSG